MKLKHKTTGEICSSSQMNTHSMSEIIVCGDEWMDSDYASNYLFYLEQSGEWVEFSDPRIVPDNYNRYFAEAKDQATIERGYYL